MKIEKRMLYPLIFIAIISITFIAGKVNLSIKFSNLVKQLFATSKNISDKKFSFQQLDGLPAPVRRYFKRVLTNGQPYINCISVIHDGQFKSDLKKGWTNIRGEEYFTTEHPGFIWKGETRIFTATDMFIAGKGSLVVSILSMFKVVNAHGEQYDKGELLRWLAESVWFPTNLLPSANLKWSTINRSSAKLTFNYNGMALLFTVRFNETGEITEMETKRFMDEQHEETWLVKCANYQSMNNVLIPVNAEVLWRLKAGDLSYAKFRVKKIAYNKPEKINVK